MSAVLTLCAVTIAVLYARRELFPGSRSGGVDPANARSPELIADWNSRPDIAVRMGPATAPVSIMMLSDFECPACRGFYRTLREARRFHPEDVQVFYVHYPLSYHRFAESAARASECAAVQGRFEAIHDALFEKQDSLGLKSWRSFAEEARVPDTGKFDACMSQTGAIARVEVGKAFGDRIGAEGTPTVLVNGWRLATVPSLKTLEGYIDRARAGKPPVEGYK